MQFCVQSAPGEATAGPLRALHLSLNAPVIAIEDLPVGPARAGIALREEAAGGRRLHIAIRALRTGQVVVYAPMASGEADAGLAPDLEAALSFAEGIGFLFDDDEVARRGGDGSGAVEALWRELVGELPERLAAAETVPGTPADAGQGVSDAAVPNAPNRPPSLSKFRFRHGAITPPPRARAAADSRIRLLSRF